MAANTARQLFLFSDHRSARIVDNDAFVIGVDDRVRVTAAARLNQADLARTGQVRNVEHAQTAETIFADFLSHTLQAAMSRAIEFNAACRERVGEIRINDLVVDEDNKLASLRYFSAADPDDPPSQEGALCGLAMWLRLCGWLIGQHIDVQSASCAGPRPEQLAAIRHFLPCPVEFGTACNSLTFRARHLDAEGIAAPAFFLTGEAEKAKPTKPAKAKAPRKKAAAKKKPAARKKPTPRKKSGGGGGGSVPSVPLLTD